MRRGITVTMVVKNEDRFVWYAVSSILPYADRVIIFDTGSTDYTQKILEGIADKKILFQVRPADTPRALVALRNEQIALSDTDWIWFVDGDEVYPQKTAEQIARFVNGRRYDGIIVRRYDLLGDIYHSQSETVGTYCQFGVYGHYVLRCIHAASIPGLSCAGEYPSEYFVDGSGKSIKERGKDCFLFVHERIFHAMYLRRSSLGGNLSCVLNRRKWKVERGDLIPRGDIPSVFFLPRPAYVCDVTKPVGLLFSVVSFLVTPIKHLKRRLVKFFL